MVPRPSQAINIATIETKGMTAQKGLKGMSDLSALKGPFINLGEKGVGLDLIKEDIVIADLALMIHTAVQEILICHIDKTVEAIAVITISLIAMEDIEM